jgi:tetratricopeptide (TPR) repeat protein
VILVPVTLGLIAAALLALHGSVLSWPFLSDDYLFLSSSRSWHDLARAFAEAPNYIRPLGRELYFFVGYHLVGPRPLAFHLVNFAILVGTLAMVMVIGRHLAGARAGVLAAAVYAVVYPHRVTMAWVSCAQDLIATSLALLAVLAHLRGRSVLAAGAYLAGLFAKESIAPLPLVLAIDCAWRWVGRVGLRARLGGAIRRTAPMWSAAAIWALVVLAVRAGRHAGAAGAGVAVADVSLDPRTLGEGLRSALLACVSLEQPWTRLGAALASRRVPWVALVLLSLVAVIAHRFTTPATSSAGRTRERGAAPRAVRLGLVWLLAGAVPVALASHHFSAYYVSFMAVGFALALGTLLTRGPMPVTMAALASAAILGVAANEVPSFRATRPEEVSPGVSWVTFVRLRYEQVFLDSLQGALRRAPPPRGGVIYLLDLPHNAAFATAGFRAPAVWFDDPSLEMTTVGRYHPGADARPSVFLRFTPGPRGFKPVPQAVLDGMLNAEAAMSRGDARAARAALERALGFARPGVNDFERNEIVNSLGVTADGSGDTATARRLWRGILTHDPDHYGALVNLAVVEADAGRFAEARRLVRRVLSRTPDDQRGLHLLVRLDRALGDSVAVEIDWSRLAAAHPAFADSLARTGGP